MRRRLTAINLLWLLLSSPTALAENSSSESNPCPKGVSEEEWKDDPSIRPSELFAAAAAAIPLLSEGYERTNFCQTEQSKCRARPESSGGIEILASAQDVFNELKNAGPATEETAQKRLFEFVSEEPWAASGIKGAISLVVQKGTTRNIVLQGSVYRAFDPALLPKTAAGFDLLEASALEAEAKKQKEVSDAMFLLAHEAIMQDWPASDQELASHYGRLSAQRAQNLEASACELRLKAGKLAASTAASPAAPDGAKPLESNSPQNAGLTGEATDRNLSSLSGNAIHPSAQTASPPQPANGEILSSFANYLDKRALEPATDPFGNQEEELFGRIHRKYQQKAGLGTFQKGLLD
jgi:ElaB/YqjD/DUF883 family membrane-anchored ribosome-binding protein